jgi:mRNA interferase RelE/StbE
VAEYKLSIKRSAAKEVEAVGSKAERRRLVARISTLAANPRPVGALKLAGHQARWRIRQGSYRILKELDAQTTAITVYKVGHRREVYR